MHPVVDSIMMRLLKQGIKVEQKQEFSVKHPLLEGTRLEFTLCISMPPIHQALDVWPKFDPSTDCKLAHDSVPPAYIAIQALEYALSDGGIEARDKVYLETIERLRTELASIVYDRDALGVQLAEARDTIEGLNRLLANEQDKDICLEMARKAFKAEEAKVAKALADCNDLSTKLHEARVELNKFRFEQLPSLEYDAMHKLRLDRRYHMLGPEVDTLEKLGLECSDMEGIAKAIHGAAKANGWWPENVYDRDPIVLLALVMTECSEAIEELRNSKKKNISEFIRGESRSMMHDKDGKWIGLGSEMADIFIRMFDIVGAWDMDIGRFIEQKVVFNATRGHRHGGKTA